MVVSTQGVFRRYNCRVNLAHAIAWVSRQNHATPALHAKPIAAGPHLPCCFYVVHSLPYISWHTLEPLDDLWESRHLFWRCGFEGDTRCAVGDPRLFTSRHPSLIYYGKRFVFKEDLTNSGFAYGTLFLRCPCAKNITLHCARRFSMGVRWLLLPYLVPCHCPITKMILSPLALIVSNGSDRFCSHQTILSKSSWISPMVHKTCTVHACARELSSIYMSTWQWHYESPCSSKVHNTVVFPVVSIDQHSAAGLNLLVPL